MFEFQVTVSCPYCDTDHHTMACFNAYMEPVTLAEECFKCNKTFNVTPREPDIDAYAEKIKKPRKKKESR